MQAIAGREEPPFRMRVAVGSYWIVGGMLALPLTILVIVARHDPAAWAPAGALLICLVVVLTRLSAIELGLTDRAVEYRSLLGRRVFLEFTEIADVRLQAGFLKYSDRFKPLFRLVVTPRPSSGKRPLVVNAKLFHLEEIKRIVKAIESRIDRSRPD